MANVLDSLMPKLLARALMYLRSQTVMPMLVNRDIANVGAMKGNTIDVPIPNTLTAVDVVPSHVPPANTDNTPKTVPLVLNNWKEVPFHLTDIEMTQIDVDGLYLPMQVQSAVEALARSVNSSIFSEYKRVSNFVGTAGTVPFATTADIINVRKEMANNDVPAGNRNMVLDPVATAAALSLAAFQDVDKAGKTSAKIEGELGRFFGFDFFEDNAVPTHTKAAAGTILVNDAAVTVGKETVNFDGITTLPAVGDVFTVAGDTETYVVTAASALASTASNVSFSPGAKVAWADNAAVTFKNSHVVNLAFHRDAFAFAMRPLASTLADVELGSKFYSMQDPKTGLVMRLEVSRQHKQTRYSIDMLWGTRLVRPELAVRLAG